MDAEDLPPAPRPPSRTGPGRPPRQRGLSQAAIVDAALEIIDLEGLDALTMRTVAHRLGTGPASLYAHVGSKEELIELVEAGSERHPDDGASRAAVSADQA